MARTVRDYRLESRAARARLKARGKPYWRKVAEGCDQGYRKLPNGKAGRWARRRYVGGKSYKVETFATADDSSDADGVTILNYHQAQMAARKWAAERAHVTAGKHGPLTVADVVASYLEFLSTKRKTAVDAVYRANAFILPSLGKIEAEALTTEKIRRWHAGLAATPPRRRSAKGEAPRHAKADNSDEGRRRRQSSANRVLTILKAALNRAWRDGKVASNGAWARVEPFEGVDASRLRYLTRAECKRLIHTCDPEFRPLLQAGLLTGARYSELTRLEAHDFNPDAGTLAIRVSKSGKSRHVVLTDEGAAFFRQCCAGRSGHELLFRKANGRPWEKSAQARPMRAACACARITPPISFHSLRHTWASLSVMAGMPLMIVARALGHSDTRMCEKHYSHLSRSFEAESVRAHAPTFGLTLDKKLASIVRP
jgi:integrase